MTNSFKTKTLGPIATVMIFLAVQLSVSAAAQMNGDETKEDKIESPIVKYNRLSLKSVPNKSVNGEEITISKDLELKPLTNTEESMASNLDSHWAWPEYTLDMIDSYSPFLFRTKKSRDVEEVKVLLMVDSKGKLSGYELLTETDKGLRERIDYLVRQLPKCKPVPGFANYSPETFELTIRK